MRTPTLAFSLKSWALHVLTHTLLHVLLGWKERGAAEGWGSELGTPSFDWLSSSLMVLMKAFEFFHPTRETPDHKNRHCEGVENVREGRRRFVALVI